MKNLLVTLLSDQTIPNVQFIKEKRNDNTSFLFVSTPKMEEKGVKNWIIQVCGIEKEKVLTKVVDQFSLEDIESKLSEINYDEYEKLIVNVTGGTKIMSMGVADYFKQKNADIYYVHNGLKYSQIFPDLKDYNFSANLTISEYLNSYGIEFSESKIEIDKEYTLSFLEKFLGFDDNDKNILAELNKVRNNKKPYKKNGNNQKTCALIEINGLSEFICKINFPLKNKEKLSKEEVKYLTGDWYEQWCYYKIREKYDVSDDFIKTGIQIKNSNEIPNELDVIYMYKGVIHIIECKTGIIALDERNILTETIYKQGALKKDFGLYAKTSIYTLSSKESKDVKILHIDRAKDFDITIKCKEDLVEFLKNN
jgi:hypothetical protein